MVFVIFIITFGVKYTRPPIRLQISVDNTWCVEFDSFSSVHRHTNGLVKLKTSKDKAPAFRLLVGSDARDYRSENIVRATDNYKNTDPADYMFNVFPNNAMCNKKSFGGRIFEE